MKVLRFHLPICIFGDPASTHCTVIFPQCCPHSPNGKIQFSHDCIENAQWNAYWEPLQIILSVAMLIRTKHPTQYSVGEMYIVCAPF